jgi:5-formaminoimidazole-4-carboxamide-1-beta-D-ribofuranosyl 5'-monophosphate synthetase
LGVVGLAFAKPFAVLATLRSARPEEKLSFDLTATLAAYDPSALTLCSIGSHSALEVASGARAQGLKNLIVTERGRNATYDRYYARRGDGPPRGCVDATLEVERFADVLDDDVQERLRRENVVFVPNRSFEVYRDRATDARAFSGQPPAVAGRRA